MKEEMKEKVNVMKLFLESEINTQELYDAIMYFITSYEIRNGEFEGNEFIIRKMDLTNFIIFNEYEYMRDGCEVREIHAAEAIYKRVLIKTINDYAKRKGIIIHK